MYDYSPFVFIYSPISFWCHLNDGFIVYLLLVYPKLFKFFLQNVLKNFHKQKKNKQKICFPHLYIHSCSVHNIFGTSHTSHNTFTLTYVSLSSTRRFYITSLLLVFLLIILFFFFSFPYVRYPFHLQWVVFIFH